MCSVSAGIDTEIYLCLDVFGFVWKQIFIGLLTLEANCGLSITLQKLNRHEKVQMRLPKVGCDLGSSNAIRTVQQRDLCTNSWSLIVLSTEHLAPGSAMKHSETLCSKLKFCDCQLKLTDSTLRRHHTDQNSGATWVFKKNG